MTQLYPRKRLEEAVSKSLTWSDTLRYLGLKVESGNFKRIQQMVRVEGIGTSHFLGGKVGLGGKKPISMEDWFRAGVVRHGKETRRRLLKLGWEYKCSACQLSSWQGRPLTLHIDHVNGDSINNTLENLRFLCPNCHQQTDTWGNKRNKNKIWKPKVKVSKSRPTKIDWMPPLLLIEEIQNKGYLGLARCLGVSDNAIRRHLRSKGYQPPRIYATRV